MASKLRIFFFLTAYFAITVYAHKDPLCLKKLLCGNDGAGSNPAPPDNWCTAKDITSMDVAGCKCQPQLSKCKPIQCDKYACGLDSPKKVKSCLGGCVDAEAECEACGIWFHTLCDCIKGTGKCTPNGQFKPGGPPVWTLLEPPDPQDDKLVTTTELLPGIVEMSRQNPGMHDEGWYFAQQNYNFKDEALALNSYRARDHQQVHIHVCDKNAATYKLLSNSPAKSSGHLVKVDGANDLFCITSTTGSTLNSFATSLGVFFNENPNSCWGKIGAGIMKDNRGWTWGCATTNTAGPLGVFC